MKDFIVKNPRLESTVHALVNDLEAQYGPQRCYEVSRHLQRELPKHGFDNPLLSDGVVGYSPEFLTNSCSNKEVGELLSQSREGQYIQMDHSWCELLKEGVRIDYLPTVKLLGKKVVINELILSDINMQNIEAEYLRIGREKKIGPLNILYFPKMGPKIGKFTLPKITRLRQF